MRRDVIPFESGAGPQEQRRPSQISADPVGDRPVILRFTPKPRRLRRRVFDQLFPWLLARVPGRAVYSVCCNLGRILAPVLNRNTVVWPMSRDGQSLVLGHCLRVADQLRMKFDIPFEIDGLDRVASTYHQHARLLLVSIHLPLNGCIHRAIHPLGVPTGVITRGAQGLRYVFGVPDAVQPLCLNPGPSLYFQVRSALAENRIVLVDLDRWYRDRTIGLTSAPIEFAARTQTPVILFASSLTAGGKVRIQFSEPYSGGPLNDHAGFIESLAQFLHPFIGNDYTLCWEERHALRRAA